MGTTNVDIKMQQVGPRMHIFNKTHPRWQTAFRQEIHHPEALGSPGLMSCKWLGVAWPQLGHIFHLPPSNSCPQSRRHWGYFKIGKRVDGSRWVKRWPWDHVVLSPLALPGHRLWALASWPFQRAFTCPILTRTYRFQYNNWDTPCATCTA